MVSSYHNPSCNATTFFDLIQVYLPQKSPNNTSSNSHEQLSFRCRTGRGFVSCLHTAGTVGIPARGQAGFSVQGAAACTRCQTRAATCGSKFSMRIFSLLPHSMPPLPLCATPDSPYGEQARQRRNKRSFPLRPSVSPPSGKALKIVFELCRAPSNNALTFSHFYEKISR